MTGFKSILIGILFVFYLGAAPAFAAKSMGPVPRKIVVLYDSRFFESVEQTLVHRMAQMPLNHLGLLLEYYDVNKELPEVDSMDDVLGVLTWFQSDSMKDPEGFLSWAQDVISSGKRFVILGDFGVSRNLEGRRTPLPTINRFLSKLGIRNEGEWINFTYDIKLVEKDLRIFEFERPLSGVLPSFEWISKIDDNVTSHLVAVREGEPDRKSQIAVTTPNGGFISPGYVYFEEESRSQLQWYVNPFEFFRLAYDTDRVPKPDTTTISGRRIFYSHIDGDGWRNITEIDGYREKRFLSAHVILKEVLEKFPDLPVSLGLIAGDIDPGWYGSLESIKLAKKILALEHIEAASHTYSHPLYWKFFQDKDAKKEAPYLSLYPKPGNAINWLSVLDLFRPGKNKKTGFPGIKNHLMQKNSRNGLPSAEDNEGLLPKDYVTPRSYAIRPFDLDFEINGSIDFIRTLLPPGKKVRLFQWSGDALPFAEAVEHVEKAGISNINGGDTRFDREYPSFSNVSPVGRRVGSYWQIYASNSNENTYTDLWTDRYFGFQHLVKTIRNTETPWRLKPFNVYYHIFSGEKLSSLNAVLDNLQYARTLDITPIHTSDYAHIAKGFFTTSFTKLRKRRWRVENRGAIQTIRFDRATFLAVDFENSTGIIGQRHYQGSLYVALDSAHSFAVIALKDYNEIDQESQEALPYLVSGRWKVSNLVHSKNGFGFIMQGFGAGQMFWKVPRQGVYDITVMGSDGSYHRQSVKSENTMLRMEMGAWAVKPSKVSVSYK